MSNTMQQPRSTMASAVRAGQQAGQNYVDIHRETNKYANKPGEINKAAYKAQSAEKQVATEVNARAKKAELKADAEITNAKINIDHSKKLASINSTNRKAGIIGAVGMLAGEAIADGRRPEKPVMAKQDFSAKRKLIEARQAEFNARVEARKNAPPEKSLAERIAAGEGLGAVTSPSNASTNTAELNSSTFAPIKYDRSNSTITGAQRAGLDVLGKYESDSVGGYDAINQIGIAGGRGVEGYSGDIRKMKQHGGRALTDMSVGEIMSLQNNSGANRQLSNQEWINQGRLHAVGRYQFIGPTFASEVQRQGIDRNA